MTVNPITIKSSFFIGENPFDTAVNPIPVFGELFGIIENKPITPLVDLFKIGSYLPDQAANIKYSRVREANNMYGTPVEDIVYEITRHYSVK